MSLFCCPVCGAPLAREERRYLCPSGHSYDLASAGYVHLLPPNRMHSRQPGDDTQMVAARAAFLARGYYAPLRDALCAMLSDLTADLPKPAVLDSGCGEGYYTLGVWEALRRNREPALAGVDLSKPALRRAAKRVRGAEFAVASVYHLPVRDASLDAVMNVFSPLAAGEFARVLKPGGFYVYVVPGARHLWEMKRVLYERPYENETRREEYPGLTLRDVAPVRFEMDLACREDIRNLFRMTPYFWRTPGEGRQALERLDRLTERAEFDLHLFRRDG